VSSSIVQTVWTIRLWVDFSAVWLKEELGHALTSSIVLILKCCLSSLSKSWLFSRQSKETILNLSSRQELFPWTKDSECLSLWTLVTQAEPSYQITLKLSSDQSQWWFLTTPSSLKSSSSLKVSKLPSPWHVRWCSSISCPLNSSPNKTTTTSVWEQSSQYWSWLEP